MEGDLIWRLACSGLKDTSLNLPDFLKTKKKLKTEIMFTTSPNSLPPILAPIVDLFVDLRGQLTCWCQDQRPHPRAAVRSHPSLKES